MVTNREQDHQLLKAIREGDVKAFEQLYQRYAPGLLGYIMQRVPSRPEAEELLQETFVRLLRDRRFEPDRAGLGTYLYVVARNLTLNYLRDNGSRRATSLEEAYAPHLETLWSSREADGPDDRLGRRQQLGRLSVALEALPEVQREAFLLRHHHGRSYQEIAELVSCPVGTAKSRVHLALNALRQALEAPLDNVTPLFGARRRADRSG